MRNLLIFTLLFLISCITKSTKNNRLGNDVVSCQDTCFVENDLLDLTINEFTESSFYKLKNSNLKSEKRIVDNIHYPEVKDTLFIFSIANESYYFLVTSFGKTLINYILINYENKYEDSIGFYKQVQDIINPLNNNNCNVTIISTETQMSYLIIVKENKKIKQLKFLDAS